MINVVDEIHDLKDSNFEQLKKIVNENANKRKDNELFEQARRRV